MQSAAHHEELNLMINKVSNIFHFYQCKGRCVLYIFSDLRRKTIVYNIISPANTWKGLMLLTITGTSRLITWQSYVWIVWSTINPVTNARNTYSYDVDFHAIYYQGPIYRHRLTYSSMDNQLYALSNTWCHYLSIPKLLRCNRWGLGVERQFHPTLYWAYDYLSMLGLKLNHVMLGLHRTPEGLGTDLRPKMAKLAANRDLVGKVVCSSYVTHQKVISYSWILAITRAYSPLKSTSSTIAVDRHKRSWNLSSSLASDPTRSWILPWSQVFVGWSWFTRLPRTRSARSYIGLTSVTPEIFMSCKLLPSDKGNSRRSRPCRRSVANRSQNITGQSEVGRKCLGPSLCR